MADRSYRAPALLGALGKAASAFIYRPIPPPPCRGNAGADGRRSFFFPRSRNANVTLKTADSVYASYRCSASKQKHLGRGHEKSSGFHIPVADKPDF